MTRICIEQDRDHPEGGFAFIVILNVDQAPDNLGFSIGDPHTGAWIGKEGDWQNNPVFIRPRAYKHEDETLFLQIGPELVDPILPQIYRISVPGLDLSEDIIWPELTPGGRSEPLETWDNNSPLPPRLPGNDQESEPESVPDRDSAPVPDSTPEPAPVPDPESEPEPTPVTDSTPALVPESESSPDQNPESVPVSSRWKLILFAAGCLAGALLSIIFSNDGEALITVVLLSAALWLGATLMSGIKLKSILFAGLLAGIFAASYLIIALVRLFAVGVQSQGITDATALTSLMPTLFAAGCLATILLSGTKPKPVLSASLFAGLLSGLFFNEAYSSDSTPFSWEMFSYLFFVGCLAVTLLHDIKLKSILLSCLLFIWLAGVFVESGGFSRIGYSDLMISLAISLFAAGCLAYVVLSGRRWNALWARRVFMAGCAAGVLLNGFVLIGENRFLENRVSDLRSELSDLRREQAATEDNLSAASADDQALQQELQTKNEQISRLERALEAGEQRLSERSDQLAQLGRDMNALQQQLDAARTERDNLRNQFAESSSTSGSQQQTINRLRRDLEESSSSLAEARRTNTDLRNQLAEAANASNSQQQTINRLRRDLEESSSSLAEARRMNTDLRNQLAQLQSSPTPLSPSSQSGRPGNNIINAAVDSLRAENPNRISMAQAERLKRLIIQEGKSGEDALTELFGPTKWTLKNHGVFCSKLGAAC